MGDNVHEGHRERVRNDFLEHGFTESTPPHKIIEMLLFYSIPRKDTNVIAHELLNRFGTISGIIDASQEELMKINGVNANTAALIKLIMPIARIYISDKSSVQDRFGNMDEICNFLLGKFIGYNQEVFAITTFSSSGKKLGYDVLNVGSVAAVGISTREIIETVLKRNATGVIMAHNHPDGLAIPSKDDVAVTEMIRDALIHINVKLIDHIIIADGDYVSMAQSRAYKHIFID